jgi:hypothetical protein
MDIAAIVDQGNNDGFLEINASLFIKKGTCPRFEGLWEGDFRYLLIAHFIPFLACLLEGLIARAFLKYEMLAFGEETEARYNQGSSKSGASLTAFNARLRACCTSPLFRAILA